MHVLVIDNGLYTGLALRLARSSVFNRVGYHVPWTADFPEMRDAAPGAGFSELVQERELFSVLDDYDSFIFPDLYHEDLQAFLLDRGATVWGAGYNEELELNREFLIRRQSQVGMKHPRTTREPSIHAAHSVARPGDIIKISRFRGDTETIRVGDDDAWYHELCLRWGPFADTQSVLVQKPLPKGPEVGFDQIIVKGKTIWPMLIGYEDKDRGYLGRNVSVLPDYCKDVYDGCMRMIDNSYSQFMSTEILDGNLIDLTTRVPQPPGDLECFLWDRLPEIIDSALRGSRYPSTEPNNDWGCQLMIVCDDPEQFYAFDVPADLREYVYLKRCFSHGGRIWVAPRHSGHVCEIGSIVAGGSTPEKAVRAVKAIADDLKLPAGCTCETSITNDLLDKYEEGNANGIEF